MKRLLVCVFLGIAGCGENTPDVDQDKPPARADDDPAAVAALEKLGAEIERDEQDAVVGVQLRDTSITDADLEHLKGLPNLQRLNINLCGEITDDGLVHLKGLTDCRSWTFGVCRSPTQD